MTRQEDKALERFYNLGGRLAAAFRWMRSHKRITMVGALAFFVIIGAGNPDNTENAVREAERIATVEAEREAQQAETIAQEKRKAEQDAAQIATYGMTELDFTKACQTLITQSSGSNDFGVFNDPGNILYPSLQSMVTQKTVYVKNPYGEKVAYLFKCWSTSDGTVEIELLGSSVQ